MCWRRPLRVPWTARRSNQLILKKEYSLKDWCWSWSSSPLATWCQEPTHWKDPDAGKDWGQGEKGATDNEMVGWRHWLNGHEFERTLGDSEGPEVWRAAVRGVTKSQSWLSGWIPTTIYETSGCYTSLPAFATVCFLNFSYPGRLIAIISLQFIAFIFWPHLKVCEILDSWPGIEPVTPSVEA